MREKQQRYRLIAACVSSSVAVLMFAALGGVGLAQSAIALAQYQYGHGAQYQYGKKVTICHKGKNTISISVNAWPAHLRHGDTEGPCEVAQAAGTAGAAKAKKGKKKQSTESTELSSTGKTKKSKGGKGAKSASAGGQETSQPAKGNSKKKDPPSAESGTSAQANVAPATSPKPKKQKSPESKKGGSASPPGLGGASPPGQGNGNGNGNGKGNGKNK